MVNRINATQQLNSRERLVGVSREADPAIEKSECTAEDLTIGVIVPAYNQARFLADALLSVLAQTRPADEIIVVDDGSSDDPASVVAAFRRVRLIRQHNRGLSAARNTGLRSCAASHVVFLDADDRLLPNALDVGSKYAIELAHYACVYGGYGVISEDGTPQESQRGMLTKTKDHFEFMAARVTHLDLLHSNLIPVPATVLYRRECLVAEGGFDEQLKGCGDYDLYLRLARRYRIASYPIVVAEYRRHNENMSNNHIMMLREVLFVLKRHARQISPNRSERTALWKSRRHYRRFYTSLMLNTMGAQSSTVAMFALFVQALRNSPITVIRRSKRAISAAWYR